MKPYTRVTPPPYPIGKGIVVGAAWTPKARRMNRDEIEIQSILLSRPRNPSTFERLVARLVQKVVRV